MTNLWDELKDDEYWAGRRFLNDTEEIHKSLERMEGRIKTTKELLTKECTEAQAEAYREEIANCERRWDELIERL